jgi:Caspase domain
MMLAQLLALLNKLNLASTSEEVADILWLAAHLDAPVRSRSPAVHPHQMSAPTAAPSTVPPARFERPGLPEQRRSSTALVSSSTSSAHVEPAQADLYPIQAMDTHPSEARMGAQPFRSPAAFALPGALEISRALRPLNRRVPSRTRMVLDEAATAHYIAHTQDWTPILNPAPERWLDVALVVDESPSMVIWQRTIAEFRTLLERQGAFRNVQVWGIQPDAAEGKVRLYAGVGSIADRTRLRRPAELIDHGARRLIFVVSDCISRMWRNGAINELLMLWGRKGLVTLVQVLPQRLWVRTALRNFASLHLRSRLPGTPNHQLDVEWASSRLRQRPKPGVPLPVVTLEGRILALWARSMAGNSGLWVSGVMCTSKSAVARHDESFSVRPSAPPSAQELVRMFYGTASPMAQRLAAYLADVPLTLPILRLVQRVMLPAARQVHLAEVFLSGLFERQTPASPDILPDHVEYEFVPGVRELLRSRVPIDEAIDVLHEVSAYIGQRSGQPLDFGALVADPTATGALQISTAYRAFARVAAPALRRFGGRYVQLAARLEASIGVAPTKTPVPVEAAGSDPTGSGDTEPVAAAARPIRGAIYALVIGINGYDPRSRVPDLYGCVNDAHAMRQFLLHQLNLPPRNIQLLVSAGNSELPEELPTRANILRAWQEHFSQAQAGDLVFFCFSGHGSQVRSDDPNEGDGLDETLVAYDSRVEGELDIRDHELAELIAPIEQRGVQVVMFLDTVHAASGFFCRRTEGNTLIFAACRENEVSFEHTSTEGQRQQFGAATYFALEALRSYHPDMTWTQVYEHMLVHVKQLFSRQTPQLIGSGDLSVFGWQEWRPAVPYLLVMGVSDRGRRIQINANPALGLDVGGRVAVYPPGSDLMEAPLTYATVVQIAAETVAADLESHQGSIPLASRVRIVSFGAQAQRLRVGWEEPHLIDVNLSPALEVVPLEVPDVNYRVRNVERRYVIEHADGAIAYSMEIRAGESPAAALQRIHHVLDQIAGYRRVLALDNRETQAEFVNQVTLTVESAVPGGPSTVVAGQAVILRLRNHASLHLYISVWALNAALGIQRIYPPRTDCLLLAAEREIQIPVTVQPVGSGSEEEKVVFKVFATRTPANLDVLHQPGVDQPIRLGDTAAGPPLTRAKARSPRPARKARTETVRPRRSDQLPSPGGPVAVAAKLWRPGQTLRVRFLDGDPRVRRKVASTAQMWTKYANIPFKFDFDHAADAEIRVSFTRSGTWSHIGTDCLHIPQDQPTMNFGWLTRSSPDTEIRRVVLREFGCALGLAMAHQSPVANIPWKREAVISSFMRPPNYWTREEIEAYFFTQYPRDQVRYAAPDPRSIMHDAISREFVVGGVLETGWNVDLSEGDKAFIAQLYPYPRAAAH